MSDHKLGKALSHTTSKYGQRVQLLYSGYLPQFLIVFAFILLILFLFPRGKSFEFSDLKVGEINIGEPIVAPFTFSINKSQEEYNQDKENARINVLPYFTRSDTVLESIENQLKSLLKSIDIIINSEIPDSTKHFQLVDLFSNNHINTSIEIFDFFISQFKHKKNVKKEMTITFSQFTDKLLIVLRDIAAVGVLNIAPEELPNNPAQIVLKKGSEVEIVQAGVYKNTKNLNDEILTKLKIQFTDEVMYHAGYDILHAIIRPNIFYDSKETEKKIRQAIARVPRAKGTVLEKEKIIGSNERITDEHIQKLTSLAEEKARREGEVSNWAFLRPMTGKLIVISVAVFFLLTYLMLSERKIMNSTKALLMVLISILLVVFSAYQIGKFSLSEYLIPIAITPMLLTIFFNPSLAFMGTVTLAVLLGGMQGNAFTTAFLTLSVGSMSILSVKKVRSRSWLFKSILWLTTGYIVAISGLELLRYSSFETLSQDLLIGMINGFLIPILTYGLSVIFEYLFEMTTDATLLELSDLNKPVLRKLALRAPGSYHHSIMVGSLAEAAAESIGANSLLARVGSYYHDIGKMDKPEYFVENQKGGRNPHEKLSPNMSVLILVSHVKRGLEIAQEQGLPKEIQAFIPEHHGTNLVTYFYNKALEKSENKEINKIDFRYPGPKPQTKETGIVMLADAVEAASRTLKEPSVSRLRNLVNNIIDERFNNSELDESPLTLRELNQIKEAFVQILTGIFHGRIEYPDQDKKLGIAQSVKSDKIEKKVELQKIRKTTSIENGDSATKPVSSDSEPIQDKKESNDTDLYSSTPEKAKP
ncbi:MAG: HDIG domain-containing protein [Deferribacteres bacterium]|nr:HDIG domain-containing protein [candidate division KSB1 bacterium]MCB9502996.1 HDIG domain-containing protein [Deferribacteres bacterium]